MRIFKNILDLLFVPKCGACFAPLPNGEDALCEGCLTKYESEKSAKCGVCAYPIRYCRCTVGDNVPLVRVSGYSTRRDSVSKQMILHLKDNALKNLLELISADMSDEFIFKCKTERSEGGANVSRCSSENTVITWIPRSRRAYRRAGHDQAEQLARLVSKHLGFPLLKMFENVGRKAQKKLRSDDRQENAEKNYRCIMTREMLGGKNVIIIDDIVTTGASVTACAEKLKSVKAGLVVALAFARTESNKAVYDDMPSVR